jgi:hypothetical protein
MDILPGDGPARGESYPGVNLPGGELTRGWMGELPGEGLTRGRASCPEANASLGDGNLLAPVVGDFAEMSVYISMEPRRRIFRAGHGTMVPFKITCPVMNRRGAAAGHAPPDQALSSFTPSQRSLLPPSDGGRMRPKGRTLEKSSRAKGLRSVDRNNKATLPRTRPTRTVKSYARDSSPRIVKLQSAGWAPGPSRPGSPLPAC